MQEEKITSSGKCVYCQQTVTKQGLTKHLATHLKQLEKQNAGSTSSSAHLVISAGPYFLHLLVPNTASLKTVDSFLRKIWLECCGHMSQFSNGGWGNAVGMSRKIDDAFYGTKKLTYQYDFGTTTELAVELKNVYALPTKSIELLSRNEPLPIMCSMCNTEPAKSICSIHIYDDGEGYYCNNCVPKHEKVCEDFADYAALPLVNSPRTGECAYEGGSIDKQRDGVYVKQ